MACCAEDSEDAELEKVPQAPSADESVPFGAWMNDCFLDVINHLLEVHHAHDAFILDNRYRSRASMSAR